MSEKHLVKLSLGILCLLFAFSAVSCRKEQVGGPVASVTASSNSEKVTVSFMVDPSSVAATRAVESGEAAVRSLDILVFRTDGSLDASARSVDSYEVTASVTSGKQLLYYVVANAPDDAFLSVVNLSGFLGGRVRLADNLSGFVMFGSGSFTASGNGAPLVVRVDRYACKVSVESVNVKWADSFTTLPSISVGRVALINVVGSTPYSGVPDAGDLWYNRMGVDGGTDASVSSMIVASRSVPVTASGDLSLGVSLFAMPNPTDNSASSTNAPAWSARNTRVALELIVDGVSNWYPVTLPAMQCNHHYIVKKLNVMGPGAASPDEDVIRSEVDFTIEVEDWTETSQNVDFGL